MNSHTPITITCNTCGNKFNQVPSSHTNGGHGCKKCADIATKEKKLFTNTFFLEKVNEKHGDDYICLSSYKNMKTNIKIKCKKHNIIFSQTPNSFLNKGAGCKECVKEKIGKARLKWDTNFFIEEAIKVHGKTYDYSRAQAKGIEVKVEIICKKHGSFWQDPYLHIRNRSGCPICKTSKGEKAVAKFLDDNKIEYIQQKRFKKLGIRFFDFYLPKHQSVIEYHGRQHYKPLDFFGGEKGFKKRQQRDAEKKEFCENNGIYFIEIPYTDFERIDEILSQKLLKKDKKKKKISLSFGLFKGKDA